MSKNCVLFVCHDITNFVISQIENIKKSLNRDKYDFYILMNRDSKLGVPEKYQDEVFLFNRQVVESHGFVMHSYYLDQKKEFYGNNFEYSFMSFYLEHKEYNFYWLVEWDVFCRGNWNDIFQYYDSSYNEVDLFTTHIEIGDDSLWQENWTPHSGYQWIESIELSKDKMVKCFNPIDRLSNAALKCLCERYAMGDYGFYELAMPTILYNCGLNIRNFEIDGESPIIDNNIRFKMSIAEKLTMRRGLVYHPIKQKVLTLRFR